MSITTVRTLGPAQLVRGRTVTLELALLAADETVVEPLTWSVRLLRRGALITTASGSGFASWDAEAESSWALAEDYILEWTFTLSGGAIVPYRQDGAVCLSLLYPVVTSEDLYGRVPRLRPDSQEPLMAAPAERTREAIAAAWQDVLSTLRARGRWPHLILNAAALRAVHLTRALELLFRGAASSLGGEYLAMAQDYAKECKEDWREVSIEYAPDEAVSSTRTGVRAPLMAGGSWASSYAHQRSRGGR